MIITGFGFFNFCQTLFKSINMFFGLNICDYPQSCVSNWQREVTFLLFTKTRALFRHSFQNYLLKCVSILPVWIWDALPRNILTMPCWADVCLYWHEELLNICCYFRASHCQEFTNNEGSGFYMCPHIGCVCKSCAIYRGLHTSWFNFGHLLTTTLHLLLLMNF